MKAAATARMFYRQAKREEGFTLVELITVVAIIALLVVYITVEIGTTNDDAKVGIANTFFLGNVPAALGSYKSRHANSCAAWASADPEDVAEDLQARGLISTTPWQDDWTAAYDATERRLIITFPTTSSDDASAAANDIASSLVNKPQVYAVRVATSGDTVADATGATKTAPDATIEALEAAQAVVVEYDCI
ncbi:MAG: prepilin-type N-terminal cleavage/methylation domain-containing protein [Gammaproteobacteria bacterium]